MKNIKLNIKELNIQSFVTEAGDIKGGKKVPTGSICSELPWCDTGEVECPL